MIYSILMAVTNTSGRLSRNKGRVRTMLKLKRLPTHITPEVLNSLTGLERVGPCGAVGDERVESSGFRRATEKD